MQKFDKVMTSLKRVSKDELMDLINLRRRTEVVVINPTPFDLIYTYPKTKYVFDEKLGRKIAKKESFRIKFPGLTESTFSWGEGMFVAIQLVDMMFNKGKNERDLARQGKTSNPELLKIATKYELGLHKDIGTYIKYFRRVLPLFNLDVEMMTSRTMNTMVIGNDHSKDKEEEEIHDVDKDYEIKLNKFKKISEEKVLTDIEESNKNEGVVNTKTVEETKTTSDLVETNEELEKEKARVLRRRIKDAGYAVSNFEKFSDLLYKAENINKESGKTLIDTDVSDLM